MSNQIEKANDYVFGTARGPTPASVLVVGESFGQNEQRQGIPFVGASGKELEKMLEQAGFQSDNIRYTNVVNARPPGDKADAWFCSSKADAVKRGVEEFFGQYPHDVIHFGLEKLRQELEDTRPELVIAVGNAALWAMTGAWGITKWRGSLMRVNGPVGAYPIPCVPTYRLAAILKQWSWRYIAIHDFRYAAAQIPSPIPEPDWNFITGPSFDGAIDYLDWLLACASEYPYRIAADIETRGGQIACIGLATDFDTAICLPFLSVSSSNGSYWAEDSEVEVVHRVMQILTHRNISVVWQNGIYDLQYIFWNWGFIANIADDTMIMQHSAFPGALPKGLDFLASMYCEYRYYWKDEGKEWDAKTPEDTLWRYNCLDACRTYEIAPVLEDTLRKLELTHIYQHSMNLHEPVLFMVLNGVRIDETARGQMAMEITNAMQEVQAWIDYVVEEEINVRSPKQLQKLFYDQIGIPAVKHPQTGRPTLNEEALKKISKKHPLLSPLTDRILVMRSAGVFSGTFLSASIDNDKRIRCQFHISGTETGRFSSTKNAFGGGTNLENIPRPRDQENTTPILKFPNIRQLFIPDPGYLIADFDLDRADAHIVAWEAGDEELKEFFRTGVDIHLANAFRINGEQLPPIEELQEDHPKYEGHLAPRKLQRQFAKNFCHGTNYGGKEKSVAAAVSQVWGLEGITETQVRNAQDQWFEQHPAIADWHEKVEYELMTKRRITTIFGRTRFYFDRINYSILHQALAYLGQSPVADVINKGLRQVYQDLPWCQLLLQNHDSIVVQFPKDNAVERAEEIKSRLRIHIPYDDPLTIPVGYKWSEESWGSVK